MKTLNLQKLGLQIAKNYLKYHRSHGDKVIFLPEYAVKKFGKKCTHNEIADVIQFKILSGWCK